MYKILKNKPFVLSSLLASMSDWDAFDPLDRREALFSCSAKFFRFEMDSVFSDDGPPPAVINC